MTPLHYTVLQSDKEMARILLCAGVPVDLPMRRQGWQPGNLIYPTNDNLQSSEADTNPRQGLTALHYAALTGRFDMGEFLLQREANPNATSNYGETPLHLALKRDLYGPKWPGTVDHWNSPESKIEVLLDLDLCDWDPDNEDE